MTANNETGVRQPLDAVRERLSGRDAWLHTDAVQAAGKIPIDVGRLGVHLLTLSGHKIYGPKGAGALYVRRETPLSPLLLGGAQESGRRGGTENVPGIVGLGRACELAAAQLDHDAQYLAGLGDLLRREIQRRISGVRFHGRRERLIPNTLNLGFEGVDGDLLLMNLDLRGIAASAGSACSSGTRDPSHVLLAMGLDREQAGRAIRISLGRGNTAEEMEQVIAALQEVVSSLRDPMNERSLGDQHAS
jgi:cysteine desulfurase